MIKNTLDIGEIAKRSGLPPSTLRFYEQKGLIKSVGRNGLRRVFEANVLEILALITLGRNSGFSLKEIAVMFTLHGSKIDRDTLLRKANELDDTITQLTAMRDGLRHAAKCSAPSHLECPKFQKVLRITVKNQQKKNAS